MEGKKTKTNSKGNWVFLGLPILAVACCGLPIILGAVGLTALGAFLTGKEVWIFGVILIIAGIVMLVKKLATTKPCQSDCCHPKISEEKKG
jgi:hypothetical protein